MAERIRIGIIGTSGYSKLLLATLASLEDAEIAAICGRTRSRAEELASNYHAAQVFTDYEDMFKHGRLDGVIIASPDDLHYPMTMAALDARLHVLCEKPMATTVEHARQMLETAEGVGVKHMVEFTCRWMPHYQYMQKLVAEGYTGRGYHYHYQILGNRDRARDDWHFDPQRSLGVLGNLASHMVDLALWINGDITQVNAHLATFSERIDPNGSRIPDANESALLTVEFADGAQGMIHASTVALTGARGLEQYVKLHGADGTLESEWHYVGKIEQNAVLRGCRHEEEISLLQIPEEYLQGANTGAEMLMLVMSQQRVGPRLFVDAIRHDYIPEPSFAQGYKVQQVLGAAMESYKNRRSVEIET
jgi:predicted dehydrogenase